jgi:L-fuculose-phosphate aldolase
MTRLTYLVDQNALTIDEAKAWMVEIGRRVYERGFVAANDGNFSMKLADGTFLCTPTGVSKGFMSPEMICRVDGELNVLEATAPFKPSSEIKMHLKVYAMRPDVRAVVHAHPPTATAFAVQNRALVEKIMPEAVIFLGEVPVAPYGTPSTDEIPDAIAPYVANHDAVLLQNHGALAYSADLQSAYYRMEGLEFYADILFKALRLAQCQTSVQELGNAELARLIELAGAYNPGRNPLVGGC